MERLVGSQELTRLFRVNRARVYQLSSSTDFPDPVAILAMGKIWLLEDIVAWAERKGRTLDFDGLNPAVRAEKSEPAP